MIMIKSQRWTRNSTLKGLELEGSISLKDAQLTKFILNYVHETIRLRGLHNYMELMYMTLLILFLLPQYFFQSKMDLKEITNELKGFLELYS